MRLAVPIVLVASLASLAGCPDRTISSLPPTQNGVIVKRIPTSADLDLLFVIDNSSSTRDKQALFAQNFQSFVTAVEHLADGTKPNLHIGVVSTSVGLHTDAFATKGCPATNDDGLLQNAPRDPCAVAPTRDRYLSDVDDGTGTGTRKVNYTGTLADALTCIAQLGTTGCGFEAQLQAMKLALDGSQSQNQGFVRDGAYLAIVFLTDEDDASVVEGDPSLFDLPGLSQDDFRAQPLYAYTCDKPISATTPDSYTGCVPRTGSYLEDPAHYYDFLVGLKDPSQLIVALIGGDPTPDLGIGPLAITGGVTQPMALLPSCHATILGTPAIGRPAIRLADFVSRFGGRGLVSSVCQADYSGVVADIAKLLVAAVSPCLEGALDVSNGMPTCTVSDVLGAASTTIPACALSAPGVPDPAGARPCWWVQPNSACGTTTNLELHVERATPAPPGTFVEADCQVVSAP